MARLIFPIKLNQCFPLLPLTFLMGFDLLSSVVSLSYAMAIMN